MIRAIFFDNAPSNFVPPDPRVRTVLVPSPRPVESLSIHGTHSLSYRHRGEPVRTVSVPDVDSFIGGPHWEPRAGIGARHVVRAIPASVEYAFFDWDGTLSVAEGIVTHDQRSVADLAAFLGSTVPETVDAMTLYLFGGRERRDMIGAYLTHLYRSGIAPRILTMNSVNDDFLVRMLTHIAPRIPRAHWLERLDTLYDVYPGIMDSGRFRLKNILHSSAKMATIAWALQQP